MQDRNLRAVHSRILIHLNTFLADFPVSPVTSLLKISQVNRVRIPLQPGISVEGMITKSQILEIKAVQMTPGGLKLIPHSQKFHVLMLCPLHVMLLHLIIGRDMVAGDESPSFQSVNIGQISVRQYQKLHIEHRIVAHGLLGDRGVDVHSRLLALHDAERRAVAAVDDYVGPVLLPPELEACFRTHHGDGNPAGSPQHINKPLPHPFLGCGSDEFFA